MKADAFYKYSRSRHLKKPRLTEKSEMETMRQRNEDLQKALRQSREREEAAQRELRLTRDRLRAVEEAEERLCAQLGDLEAESHAQTRYYLLQIGSLTEQLSRFGQFPCLAAAGQS